MEQNRPRAREKYVSGKGEIHTSGTSGGPVGSGGFGSGGGGGKRSGGGGLGKIAAVILALLLGGGGGYTMLSGGSDTPATADVLSAGSGVTSGWHSEANIGKLNTSVDSAAREKLTTIKGNGKDTVTIMMYMCGADLESKSAMATSDLKEMLAADIADNVNLIVYTGGCTNWRNNVVSSRTNQIYQIRGGKLYTLVDNVGSKSMTDPATLTEFIKWTAKNYPANRTELIFWDHGSGSISGYGYDEKYPRSGTMSLAGINNAIEKSKVKFDFIGFDTCLMATAETALMLGNDADYLIASEESEPGVGWYYTNWLSALSQDTSTPTLEIGQRIVDDFTKRCQQTCPGQATTLSVTDLAELSQTLPDKLTAFANSASGMIEQGSYKTVATARSGSKEFARSAGIDQIDLVHFAKLIGTNEAKALSDTLLSAVKYNMTSRSMANSYGLSIYFPYKKLNSVDSITNTYSAIGMDAAYTKCIRRFAQMEVSGQAVSGGSYSPFPSLSGSGSSGAGMSSEAMQQLIGLLLSGGYSDYGRLGIEGLDRSNTSFLSEDPLDADTVLEEVSADRLSDADLMWQEDSSGGQYISLSEEKWEQVQRVDKAFYYDNGNGYLELGLDNLFSFDDDGNLIPNADQDWLAINGQPVAYYHTDTMDNGDDDYMITGRVPVKLNGDPANLILVFDQDNPHGYVAGATYEYEKTETIPKNLTGLEEGDEITFLCDLYTYEGKFKENQKLGKKLTVKDPDALEISNVELPNDTAKILYRFTDVYDQNYWTSEVN